MDGNKGGFDDHAKADIENRLQDLNKRFGREKSGQDREEPKKPNRNSYGNAFRLSSEFISAILVGAALGYGIDWLAGTTPWAMIVLLLLGFVAGVLNILRVAGELTVPNEGTTNFEADNVKDSASGKNRM